MPELDQLIKAWDEGHWELSEAFVGLGDEDVWRRPHPRLLSIGELAAHIAYCEAVRITGPGTDHKPDLADVPIKSPLIDWAFRYYLNTVESTKQLELGAADVLAEVARVHGEAKAVVTQVKRDSEDPLPRYGGMDTWGSNLRYLVFHIAYHTGQVYSVRHLFGHETQDN